MTNKNSKWSNNEALPAPFHPQGIMSPGITEEARKKTAELIKKNHYSYHCFFNEKGFHNHTIHHVLAAFSFGAPPARLQEVFDESAKDQQPIGPLLDPSITRDNWQEHLGKKEYYHNFLNFFRAEVNERGAEDVLADYIFTNKNANEFFIRFIGGVFHPFIHVGYGLEFSSPLVLAEGLSMAAVHSTTASTLFKASPKESSTSLSALAVIDAVYNDKEIDGKIQWEDENKFNTVYNHLSTKIAEHAEHWKVPKDDVLDKARELMGITMALYAGTTRPGQKDIKLDFFLMHCLTSSLFLPIYLAHLSPEHSAKLVHSHFMMTLVVYVARGRPRLHLSDYLSKYKPDLDYVEKSNPWLKVIERAIAHDDTHLVKAIRALAHGDVGLAHRETDAVPGEEKITNHYWLKSAQLTLDAIRGDRWWTQTAIGFDEAWDGNSDEGPNQIELEHAH